MKSFQFGERQGRLETGEIARQASGAVIVSMGDTKVMVTVVGDQSSGPRDFMPLTVDYEERAYAAGRIPGGFFKREGKPSEKAILTCRLIDRPIRPMFPDGFSQDSIFLLRWGGIRLPAQKHQPEAFAVTFQLNNLFSKNHSIYF